MDILKDILKYDSISSYAWVIENYHEEIDPSIDLNFYKEVILSTMKFIEDNLGFSIPHGKGTGIVLHMVCAIKRITVGDTCSPCEVKEKILDEYCDEVEELMLYINKLTSKKELYISEDEICFILRNVLEIHQ